MATHQQLHRNIGANPRVLRPHSMPLPRHFLVRPATTKHTASGTITMPGPMVPLIALDQLPEWIDIAGVPRELTVEQTMGLQNLGTVIPETTEHFEVRLHQDVRFVTSSSSPSNALKRRSGGSINPNPASSPLIGPVLNPRHMDIPGGSGSSSSSKQGHNSTNSSSYSSSGEPAVSSSRSSSKKTTTTKKGKEKAVTVSKTETTSKGARGNTITKPSVVTLNPRLPTPPPATIPVNPYTILRHHRDAVAAPPGPNHPATRLLSAITPASGYIYSPAHPQQQTPTNNNNSKSLQSSPGHNRAIVYCRHWCHHGSCKYGLECRYEHRMPQTHEGLREVGLADWPNWYRAAWTMALNMQTSRRSGRHESWPDFMAAVVDAGSGSRRKGGSSQQKARGGGSGSSHNVVLGNDGSSTVSTATATIAHAEGDKSVIVEERLGRLRSAEIGGSNGSSSETEYGDPKMEAHHTAASKRQDRVAGNITPPVENLVDI